MPIHIAVLSQASRQENVGARPGRTKPATRPWSMVLGFTIALALLLVGCTAAPIPTNLPQTQVDGPAWHQGFEQHTDGWITAETTGSTGWCGEIQRYERGSGPVSPAEDQGYAIAAHGTCNDFWADAFPTGSGPYAPYGSYSESWPQNGFAAELDLYLDSSWAAATNFNYAVSIHMLDVDAQDYDNNPFRYFFFPVAKQDGNLSVAGHEVGAGWHTFRILFGEEDGQLAVDFELAQDGRVLFTQPVTTTSVTGESTSSFPVSNVGTGYSWLDLSEGEAVAIDEHRLRLGLPAEHRATASVPNVFDITARGLQFEAPDQIPAGWTTFRLNNLSGMHHFALVERLPEGMGAANHQAEIAPLFQEGMDLLNAGDVDGAMAAFGGLPAWFQEVVIMGGPGLTAPGQTSQATVYLEPGTYMLECYVKTDGIFHSYNPAPDLSGMVYEFTVTEEASGAPAPQAGVEMTISSERGIEVDGEITTGEQTFAVTFADQAVHENFAGHDVHLVRLEDDTDMAALAAWLDWTGPTGLETPGPATFLGGTNEMPGGETAYFTVRLTPGEYAWIAEVPNAADKGMLKTFTVGR